jgi:hypothetical protein
MVSKRVTILIVLMQCKGKAISIVNRHAMKTYGEMEYSSILNLSTEIRTRHLLNTKFLSQLVQSNDNIKSKFSYLPNNSEVNAHAASRQNTP